MTGADDRPLLERIGACRACPDLPLGPRPILQWSPRARILIAGQAPGRKTHASGLPFDDASGDRLRRWLGVSRDTFYDPDRIAILPMAFCFPGSGKGGDAPPPARCAALWRAGLLAPLTALQLTIAVGRYAADWHDARRASLTERVRDWASGWPHQILLPHPSPRNNRWLARNPWFEEEIIPRLQERVADILSSPA
ncbi:uracil-DNA glycosylase family protein [Sphingopyxis sp. MWB1]|uniref:uracil-DNA glycosylase family protein n=1 Tax=Sphingopyxis sp. MWB1 TaxID=1537715 RepID=UPI00051A501E|nr:uracil-DNA glycosylase family protein [Sphingopyxis sp. MWB1]